MKFACWTTCRSSTRSRVVAGGALVALVALLAGCGSSGKTSAGNGGGPSTTNSTHVSAGKLVIAPQGPINTFDPWGGGVGLNGSMMYEPAVYDELLHLSNTGKIIPWLATSWKVVNPKVITLQLRKGVKFQDGTTFNANAVKANFDYAQATKTPGQCNSDLAGVVTKVTGPYSATLKLKTPNPDILLNMATCAGYMVSPQALRNPSTLTSKPDGTGPYTYDQGQSVQNQTWVFKKKANYWAPNAYPFQTVVFNYFRDQTSADNAGHSGQVDFIQVIPVDDHASGLTILKSAPNLFRGMAIADVKGDLVKPLGNKLVREAMNYAIDRNAILKSLYANVGRVDGGSTPFAPGIGLPGYTPALDKIYPYNPAKAKQLLKQAGYGSGFSFPVMDSPTDTNSALLQAIAGYERKVGVNMRVTMNSTTFIPSMLSGKNPAFFAQYTLSGAQYQNLVGLASKSAFWNPRQNQNPVFDTLLTKLASASGGNATALYEQFARAFADEAWWVAPVLLPNAAAYNSSKVKPYITNNNPCPMLYQFTAA